MLYICTGKKSTVHRGGAPYHWSKYPQWSLKIKIRFSFLVPFLFTYFPVLSLTVIKAPVPHSVSEEDLHSAVAQQDCRPQISIQCSHPKAFDFMMGPTFSLPHAKRENLSGPPVNDLLKEDGLKASATCIAEKRKAVSYQLASLLKL